MITDNFLHMKGQNGLFNRKSEESASCGRRHLWPTRCISEVQKFWLHRKEIDILEGARVAKYNIALLKTNWWILSKTPHFALGPMHINLKYFLLNFLLHPYLIINIVQYLYLESIYFGTIPKYIFIPNLIRRGLSGN